MTEICGADFRHHKSKGWGYGLVLFLHRHDDEQRVVRGQKGWSFSDNLTARQEEQIGVVVASCCVVTPEQGSRFLVSHYDIFLTFTYATQSSTMPANHRKIHSSCLQSDPSIPVQCYKEGLFHYRPSLREIISSRAAIDALHSFIGSSLYERTNSLLAPVFPSVAIGLKTLFVNSHHIQVPQM